MLLPWDLHRIDLQKLSRFLHLSSDLRCSHQSLPKLPSFRWHWLFRATAGLCSSRNRICPFPRSSQSPVVPRDVSCVFALNRRQGTRAASGPTSTLIRMHCEITVSCAYLFTSVCKQAISLLEWRRGARHCDECTRTLTAQNACLILFGSPSQFWGE